VNRRSPTLEGFRALFRRPALGAAEVAWRWCYGTAFILLVGVSLMEYLDTLRVKSVDLLLLQTRQPLLVSRAINDILRGSAFRFVMATAILTLALTAGWILVASLGRSAIVGSLLDYFRGYQSYSTAIQRDAHENIGFGSMLGLHFLRALLGVAAVLACVGAFFLGSLVSPDKDPQPFLSFLVLTSCLVLVWFIWSTLNWYLSLAAIFVVRDGADSLTALSSALGQFRQQAGAFFAVGFWFGLAHLTAFFIATSVVGLPLAFAGVLPFGVVVGGVSIITLAYFAAVDWLYAGRLAAYVSIVEGPPLLPEPTVAPQIFPELPDSAGAAPPPEVMDYGQSSGLASFVSLYPPIPPSDDDILSDVPGLPQPKDPEQS
jgi:hypothetical protein